VQIRDLDGNAIRSITLDEGGSSSYFTLAGTTFDPDESIAVALANTTYFTVQSQLVDNVTQYRLVHNSASGVPTQVADLTLTPTVTLTDSGVSATYTASATPLSVAVNEIATTPLLSSTTPVAVAINDGQAGLKFSLPTRTNAGMMRFSTVLKGSPHGSPHRRVRSSPPPVVVRRRARSINLIAPST
jgi:hypothetical protein